MYTQGILKFTRTVVLHALADLNDQVSSSTVLLLYSEANKLPRETMHRVLLILFCCFSSFGFVKKDGKFWP